MKEIKNLLEEEIESQIQNLSNLPDGSKEKSDAIDDLSALYKLRLDEMKITLDHEEKSNNRKTEERLKEEQLVEQINDRYFKLAITAAEIILPMLFYATWMRKGFKFEETGTFTSTTFRNLFNRFKPTKK